MHLLAATGEIQNAQHKRAPIRELRRVLAYPPADTDAGRDLTLFLTIRPSAPAPLRFTW